MKFTCTKENLIHGLQIVSGIAGKSTHLPILSNVLIDAKESGVELISTNLEIAVKAFVRAKSEVPGSFTVPAKTFLDFVQLISDDRVELSVDGNELLVKGGNSSTRIKGIPADEFPVIPDIEEQHAYLLLAEQIKQTLSQVTFAASKNDIRPELSGVFFSFAPEGSKELVMAATDSYRLAEARTTLLQGAQSVSGIVPAKTALECIRLLGIKTGDGDEETVRLWMSEGQIALRHNQFEITSRLIGGNYPDYRQIIPKEFRTTANIDKDQLVTHVKSASLFTTTGVNAVAISVRPADHIVNISSTSTQTGQHDSSIDADVIGEENSILLNHRYVLDGLSHIAASTITFEMNSPDTPCIVRAKDNDQYLYIVMPIRQ